MMRILHRWPGLLAAIVVFVLALSGAVLSIYPTLDRLTAPQAASGLDVASLAARVQRIYPGIEEIRRSPSGKIAAYWVADGSYGSGVIDPATGQAVAGVDPSPTERWVTDLHRSLFLEDTGRWAVAAGAAAMLLLAASGAVLVARRVGGWRRWFAPIKGALTGQIHVELARVAVVGLVLSSVTGLWMTAETFDLITLHTAETGTFAADQSGSPMPVGRIAVLSDMSVSSLRSLTFPDPTWPGDTLKVETAGGVGQIDPVTGTMLDWADGTRGQKISETIYMLHTGQGAAVLGLLLGLMALAAPAMAVTGVAIWWAGYRRRPRIRGSVRPGKAATVILVGSEGGSTWGFAATLAHDLIAAGQSVHVGPMSGFAPDRYGQAARILVLAATYGDGAAPSSARGFLDRIAALDTPPKAPLAVLGFGDSNFPAFCAFAREIEHAAHQAGWAQLLPRGTVDRQSPQDFARWGRGLGAAMGVTLELVHRPVRPASHALTLLSRRDYGAEVQAPTAILRFALPRLSLWQRLAGHGFGGFAAGDLIGILPEGADLPRFYSLASARRDGFVEIVVRKQPGGVCSGQLMSLVPGASVRAFVRRNHTFRPGAGRAPLILIGAGTGVGPLAGFIRANARHRRIHLFFGMRHADSDFLYQEELHQWGAEGRLTILSTATSRDAQPHYVQDALRADAAQVAAAIRDGARVMVCGGRDMAAGVAAALEDILVPVGLTPKALKAEGRYVEDVY
ncbi:PepSY domain-containing protein [Yoonia sp.]|uniref:PepSY domain-containing protein n=1 Tax=Yoonia sp. TaxID=2212373 RepID=UPI003F6AE81A